MKTRLFSVLAFSASLFLSPQLIAKEKDSAFVPFYFSTETMGSTIGLAGVAKGVGQPQAALFGMGLYSEKDSYVGFLSAFNYALSPNLLFSTQMYQARFNDNPYYLGDQGSNNSSTEDKTVTNGDEENYKLEFKYLLPWGNVREHGLLGAFQPVRDVSFASPVDSGVSSIIFTPFYSSRELDIYNDKKEEATGFSLTFDWDNRDSVRNTTRGSHTSFDLTTGAESLQSEDLWLKWEFQNSQYYSLGPLGDWFDQQVLAFDFYTADTPTWNKCDGLMCARPPEQEQVRLGGLYRLRGYTAGRYHGRSAIHYSAEYRVLPDWQPLDDIPLINYYDLPWWQWVAFVEVGRVADDYDLKTLHEDMKWNVGGAVRFQVEGIVVRAEMAKGADEGTFRVMINQPF
ncbi:MULTISPECIES: BamA/TamA family outer membrane protein [Vibrio]|uniref:Surface antigen family protein n=1 Tax=Vibrio owensii TaxID=696485 RepID=A0AAU9Q4Z4_9VIBR|nr:MULTISPECIES: BamA/TamA family outer membrane protein [Vibrio]EKM25795.1 surface antigen family protein [Vibrio sp. HENC-03]CAD7798641.1 Part of the outer membrane protein assembly complex [Vibrio sp. B1ASS3]CAE6883121.1 Part of the outer membrane protein assembly complex [Vibrio sp. B1ASS3]CAH1528970.1 Surface antigen family protein [Vibrio owensii]CAH1530165.1 Surface antigen family protein [Vibrio owensii]